MKNNFVFGVCVFLSVFQSSYEFLPDILPGITAASRHHTEITRNGIGSAIGGFIKDNNLTILDDDTHDPFGSEHLRAFFEDDADGRQEYSRRVQEITDVVKEQERSNLAYIHCNSEEIELAHNYIIKLRNEIRILAATNNPDLTIIREKIGKCIYTHQAFYSTTNWIELYGISAYTDFGVPGRSLMNISGPGEATCNDCDNSGADENSCKGNLITDKLTSGYQTGQTGQQISYDPNAETVVINSGKCGFGGISDSENGERFGTAKGGINKDRHYVQYSPHYHLHGHAFISAWRATTAFLTDQETGIINELKNDLFKKVFNLIKRIASSMVFVIDVTGSMANDIAQVKRASVEIITNVMGTPNEPVDYVLVTFSDPVGLTTHVLTTSDGLVMIATIENLTVAGGADCPEYAMSGMLKGVAESRDHSTLFLFSDAPPKDEEDWPAVADAINAKEIDLIIMINDLCSRRKKRDLTSRYKRQTDGSSVYHQLAEATGGTVHQISTSNLAEIMQQITDEKFPSATAIIDMFPIYTTDSNTVSFLVDSNVKNIKITVTGASDTSHVTVESPLGSVMTEENANMLFDSPDKVIVSVVNPSSGVYSITRTVSNNWNVNITAQTSLDFDYTILEEKEGYFYKLPGNPILGENYAIFLTVYSIPANTSVSTINLEADDGSTLQMNITELDSDFDTRFYAFVRFTSESYKVSITGEDKLGFQWKRTSAFTISPVNVQLGVLPVLDLYIDTSVDITYNLTNFGTKNETFIVSIADDRGLVTGSSSFTYEVSLAESKEVKFQIQGSSSYNTVTYTVTVQKYGSTLVLQQDKKTLFINPQSPPVCTVLDIQGPCDNLVMNSSCSDVKWYAQSSISFTAELSSVTVSNDLPFSTSSPTSSPVQVNVSGDCCSPSAYLTTIDKNSNFVRCHLYLGEVTYAPVSKPTLTTQEKIAIGVVSGIVIACIIGALVITISLYRGAVKPQLDAIKVADANVKAVKILPQQSDRTSKMNFTPLNFGFGNIPPQDTKFNYSCDMDVVEID